VGIEHGRRDPGEGRAFLLEIEHVLAACEGGLHGAHAAEDEQGQRGDDDLPRRRGLARSVPLHSTG